MAKHDTDMKYMEMGNSEEHDRAYDTLKAKQEGSSKAKNVLRGAGYARGGGVSPVRAKKIADKEVHKHEKADHPGKKPTKLKQGGKIDGGKTLMRADKFARGGSAPSGKHTRTHISINVGAGQAEKQQAMRTGVQLGARLAAAKMGGGARPGAGAPMQARGLMPGGPAPGGAMPGGPMPGGAPPMASRGGRYAKGGKVGPARVTGVPHLKGGAGGAKGRLSKIADYGSKPKV